MVQSNNIFNENPIGFPSNLGQQGQEHIQQSNINQISHVNNDNDNGGCPSRYHIIKLKNHIHK